MGWAILGFFLPVVGLILCLVWKDSKPMLSEKAAIGAIAGAVAFSVIYLLSVVLLLLIAMEGSAYDAVNAFCRAMGLVR